MRFSFWVGLIWIILLYTHRCIYNPVERLRGSFYGEKLLIFQQKAVLLDSKYASRDFKLQKKHLFALGIVRKQSRMALIPKWMTNTCSVSLSLIKMFINHTRHRKIFFTPSPGASIKKVQFFFETHLKRSRKFYKIFNFAINRTCFSKTNINSVESLSSILFVKRL